MLEKIKQLPLWAKILISVLAMILVIAVGVGAYGNYLYGKMNVEKPEDVAIYDETFEIDEPDEVLTDTEPEDVKLEPVIGQIKSKDVINILLTGEEAINSDVARGRTDSIMIATLNKKEKALRLTSVMRDSYVTIPGHSDNKINAAFGIGGMPLLMETIETNFGIDLDGYVLVGFDGFEQIIDYLGGIEISLSSTEASYLNRTDYITNYWNRNLQAGVMTLNGDQALGYARVRKVNNGDQSGDFGRTQRHRIVLNAIYEKFKGQSLMEMLNILPDMLELVTTDLTRGKLVEYLTEFAVLNSTDIETLRIPADDAYKMTRVRGMSVVIPDLQVNSQLMHDFIFGTVETGDRYQTAENQTIESQSVNSATAPNQGFAQ